MTRLRKHITRSPRVVSEKYLDDISANLDASNLLNYGLNGFLVLDSTLVDTTPDNFTFYAIKALESSVISTTTDVYQNLDNQSIIVTDVIFGNFTSVICHSGKVLVYVKEELTPDPAQTAGTPATALALNGEEITYNGENITYTT